MRTIMCVHFPSWSIQRIKRRQNDWGRNPLVLVDTINRKMLVVAACNLARAKGIRIGMTPTHARALDAATAILPYKAEEDLQALKAVGRWMMRFSPVVAIEPPASLFLDLLGLEKLFGSPASILTMVDKAIARLRLVARMAVASTPGAAWAFAVFGQERLNIIPPERSNELLGILPIQSLRLDPSLAQRLNQLGLINIGQLCRLSRDSLAARFDSSLLLRLDQALGNAPELLTGLQTSSPIFAELQLDSPIESLETIWLVLERLIAQVIRELSRCGRGARIIKATFAPPYARTIEQTIQLSKPSRNPANLFDLLRLALENIETDEGFIKIRLDVVQSETITDEQIPLIQHEEAIADSELVHLIERLTVRMEKAGVITHRLAESHIPELAYQPSEPSNATAATSAPAYVRAMPRPLRLLANPIEIKAMVLPSDDREGQPIAFTHEDEVYRLLDVAGPERIAGQWWDGRDKTRDYFDVQTASGRRFWIFRVMQTARWYLHGVFE